MKVYTTTPVLKEAWALLNELGLNELLSINKAKVITFKYGELINSLIMDDKLDDFCAIITKKDTSVFTEMEFTEKKGLISDFFSVFGDPFKPLLNSVRSYLDRIVETLTLIASQNTGQSK